LCNRLILVFLLLAASAGPAFAAATPARQREDLRQLRERIESLQRRLAAAEESRTDAADALRDSERAISVSNRALRELAEQQRATGGRLAGLQEQSRRSSADIQAQQARLARLLYQQYTGGQPDALKLLLNREDPNQTARNLHYLVYLAQARADLIQGLRTNLNRFDELSREASQESASLAALRAEEQSQRRQLEQEKRARKEVLVRVSRQIDRQQREMSTLKRNETRLARLVEQLGHLLAQEKRPPALKNEHLPDASGGTGVFAEMKGSIRLPVRGELKSRFGSPRSDSGLTWKGLFIAAAEGQDVKAVAPGRVVFADWLRGFGNLFIIDHGSGYMSLYGNNETLYKQVGEAIKGGDTVAAVGNSGGNADSGLYFEIRHQGRAVDPMGWVNLK
jgi:septal ring factor EnvC (AmiA/AmiB activator)